MFSSMYIPSKSEVVPLVVPLIITLANANGSSLYSLSVNVPVTDPVWANVNALIYSAIRVKNCFR